MISHIQMESEAVVPAEENAATSSRVQPVFINVEDSLCAFCKRVDITTIISSKSGPPFEPCGHLLVSNIESHKDTCPLCRMIWGMMETPWQQMNEKPWYERDRGAEVISDLRSGYFKPAYDYFSSEKWHQFRISGHMQAWMDGKVMHNTFSVGIDETWDQRDMMRDRHFTRATSRLKTNIFPIKLRKAKQIEDPDPEFIEAGSRGLKELFDYMREKEQEWDKPQGLGNIDVFVPRTSDAGLRPEDFQYSEMVDFDFIKFALSECERDHGELCHMSSGSESNALTLMDLENNRMVELPMSTRYFALSYLWGRAGEPMEVDYENGIFNPDSFPLTLKDAILFLNCLGERYLWIDYVCINQADREAKTAEVQKMDIIYANAYATIIAAAGIDSNAGLPGVRPETRQVIPIVESIGEPPMLFVRETPPLRQQLKQSTWNTRAWTFQESILSRRCIVFSYQEVFFQCRTMHQKASKYDGLKASGPDSETLATSVLWKRLEGDSKDNSNPSTDPESPLPSQLANSALWNRGWRVGTYVSLMETYSSRQMTFESDAVPAFVGIMSMLQKTAAPEIDLRFYWGMPSHDFDTSLNWKGHGRLYAKRRAGIPSWSSLSYPHKISGPSSWCIGMSVLPDMEKFEYVLEDPATGQLLKVGEPFPEKLVDIGLSTTFSPSVLRIETWAIPLSFKDDKDAPNIDAVSEEGLTWRNYVGAELEAILICNRWGANQERVDDDEWKTVMQVPVMLIEHVGDVAFRVGEKLMMWEEWQAGNPQRKSVRIH